MTPTTFAIISDLHFGKKARSSDLCPSKDGGPTTKDTYRARFLDFISAKGLKADYLIVPGDVAEAATYEEVNLASTFLLQVAKALKVRKNRIAFVPGNHDVDWAVLEPPVNPVRMSQRYDSIVHRSNIFKSISGKGDLYTAPFVASWSFDNVDVVGYNSSWHDKPKELVHHGRIDPSHFAKLEQLLAAARHEPDVLRLFLVHHHPVAYDQPVDVPGWNDFSQMVNSEQLFTLLRKYYFDLVVHGHTHQPRFQTKQDDGAVPIGILAAGSFSLQLPTEWQGIVNNQFHMIRVDGRDPKSHCIQGQVDSWTYYFARGWQPSTRLREGIDHVEPFGVYLTQHQCIALLAALLPPLFAAKGWLNKDDIIKGEPSLKFIRPSALLMALEELAPKLNFFIHNATYDGLMLVTT